jgi:6-phosphogluconolactonase
MMTLFMENSPFDLGCRGADLLATAVRDLLTKQKTVLCAFCGGNSINPLLSALLTKSLPWSNVQIFLTDERLVRIDSSDSNYKHLNDSLFAGLVENGFLPKENVHPFIMKEFLPDFGISLYQKELESYGKAPDIVIVSAGEDGHIASLFPNHASVQNKGHRYSMVENAPKPPVQRMSLSSSQIQTAHFSIILFSGQAKKKSFEIFLQEKTSVLECPAVMVKQTEKTFVLSDIKR